MAIANLNGVDLYYERMGHGERVVLTHGAWGDARNWDAVAEPLAQDYEVVRWDRRGHSRSQAGPGPGSYHEDAADLAALIEHLGPEAAHVYGTSSGGTVTLTLVAERPELVASAAVHEPAADWLARDTSDTAVIDALADLDRTIEAVNALIRKGDHAGGARAFIDMAIGPEAWERLPEEARATYVQNAPAWLDESGHARTLDLDALAKSDMPLMITYGTESPGYYLAAINAITARIPRIETRVLKSAGHVPYRTHPDLWLSTLRSYLPGVTSGSPVAAG